MPVHVARRASLLSALVAVASLAVVGCGAHPGNPVTAPAAPSTSASGSPSAPASASRTLTAEELVAAALPTEASPDAYGHPVSVRRPRAGERESEVSDPACARLLEAAHARRPSRPAPAVAEQTFNWRNDPNGGDSTLASYGNSGAVAVFAEVSDGLGACRYYESPGPATTYKGTVTVGPAPRLGDEAVQFEITAPTEGGSHVTQYTVVRTGSVIATFTKLSVGDPDLRAFPPALIARQISLLQQAQS
ncbi:MULTISPECIES: hypothetical protein [Streptomyces]|uniref:PknH-like protein n=1 Tax=Streptomyces spororaveus TaxID=284039 RepID=A0ABQ3T437_9ACTN|nr:MULTISPECIES: hypothetical protein [Streptomyces]MCM9077013.1 hypothetical protein [Streptomyces spororaveus]MCX5308334.1 hypothetical protein [Streptomyces sp. NBC_00160]GHI75158.1 hypothetical protein Sspor_07190 [Streptomyces spororaveus]